MVFENAITALDPITQTEIRTKLTLLAASGRIGNHVVQGLFTEPRLPASSVADVLQHINRALPTVSSLRKAFEAACHRHILEGPRMKGRRPKILGRAIPTGRFRDMLVKRRIFSSARAADAFFRAVHKLPLSKQRSKLRNLPLGRFVIWATFSSSRSTDPFAKLPNDADEIQDALGFPVESRGDDLWLFVYRPPSGVPLLFPTVADAEWNDVFCPAPSDPNIQHGLTRPSRDKPHLACQPEIVHHDRVNCDALTAPIRYLPALMTPV